MSIITFTYTTSGTGYSGAWNDVWATVRGLADGLNTVSSTMPLAYSGNYGSSPIYQIYRGFTNFDTSSLSKTYVVSARMIISGTVQQNADSTSLHVVAGTQASTSTLANADYDQAGATSFGSKTLSSITNGVPFAISLNTSGISNISTTGLS